MKPKAATVMNLPLRRLVACAVLALLSAAVSSCSHKPLVSSPKIPPTITRVPVRVSVSTTTRPKHLPPIAFPDLDTGQISGVTFSPDGKRLAFGYGMDAAVSVLDLTTGRLAWQRHIDSSDTGSVAFTRDGRRMIIACSDPDSVPPFWVCTAGGRLIRKLPGYGSRGSAWLVQNDRYLVTSDQYSEWSVWDTRTWHRIDQRRGNPADVLSLTPAGRIVRRLPQSPAESLLPPDAQPDETWARWMPPLPSDQGTTMTAVSGRYLVRAGGNHDLRGIMEVWDIRRRVRLWVKTVNDGSPRSLAISPDGRLIAVGSLQGDVDFWDSRTGRLLHHLSGPWDVVRSVVFSPNGRVLAVAGGTTSFGPGLFLVSAATYQKIATCHVAFSEFYSPRNWALTHPDWFTALPDLSYIASPGVVRKIRTPGRPRDAALIAQFDRPRRVRDALRLCYSH